MNFSKCILLAIIFSFADVQSNEGNKYYSIHAEDNIPT